MPKNSLITSPSYQPLLSSESRVQILSCQRFLDVLYCALLVYHISFSSIPTSWFEPLCTLCIFIFFSVRMSSNSTHDDPIERGIRNRLSIYRLAKRNLSDNALPKNNLTYHMDLQIWKTGATTNAEGRWKGKILLEKTNKNSFRDATNGDAVRELLMNQLDVTNCAITIEDFNSKQGEMKRRAVETFSFRPCSRSKLCI